MSNPYDDKSGTAYPTPAAPFAQPVAAQPVAYAQPAGYAQPVAYAQPVGYGQQAGYAQPAAYAQPAGYAQPIMVPAAGGMMYQRFPHGFWQCCQEGDACCYTLFCTGCAYGDIVVMHEYLENPTPGGLPTTKCLPGSSTPCLKMWFPQLLLDFAGQALVIVESVTGTWLAASNIQQGFNLLGNLWRGYVGGGTRRKIREKYGISAADNCSCNSDFCSWAFCGWCAAAQEYKFLRMEVIKQTNGVAMMPNSGYGAPMQAPVMAPIH